MSITKEVNIDNKVIKFEFNKFAKQAAGSVMISCGDTQVLVTVCASPEAKEGQDFFPLTVDYIEKYYAAGRIPGGYLKREARPGENETLTSRVIDRPLRPCFPSNYLCETQVMATVMSYDPEHDPTVLALIGASTVLMISDIPFDGPVAGLRLGKVDGKYILDPKHDTENLDLDLMIACKKDAVLMVEAAANFMSEEDVLDAIDYAHNLMQPLFEMQLEIQKEIGKEKRVLEEVTWDQDFKTKVEDAAKTGILSALEINDKIERYKYLRVLSKKIKADLNPDKDSDLAKAISNHFENAKYNVMRNRILKDGVRIGGRDSTEVRNIDCETSVLNKAHGSSLFTRGETQALASITLGSSDDEQRADSIQTPDASNSFLLHYNFPAYSVGEARPLRSPGRRELGHGALARKALIPILPKKSDFGYTIRVVSEVLESNGSSSMATVCSGSMAMLDAGVPIKEQVAGIAMGLIKEGDDYVILSDILGDEDHLGDMDFKVCGTATGITALQMDIKISGLSKEIMQKALNQALVGRKHILTKMQDAISKPSELSENAPRIFYIKIPTDTIKDLIGPGGKTIKKITADTNTKLEIDDSGMVSIVAPDIEAAQAARAVIRQITTKPEVGQTYLGKVVKIMDFGAFIQVAPGSEGLCHISELENRRVNKVTDILTEGEEVMVKVLDIDRSGKIKLSRKAALEDGPKKDS